MKEADGRTEDPDDQRSTNICLPRSSSDFRESLPLSTRPRLRYAWLETRYLDSRSTPIPDQYCRPHEPCSLTVYPFLPPSNSPFLYNYKRIRIRGLPICTPGVFMNLCTPVKLNGFDWTNFEQFQFFESQHVIGLCRAPRSNPSGPVGSGRGLGQGRVYGSKI